MDPGLRIDEYGYWYDVVINRSSVNASHRTAGDDAMIDPFVEVTFAGYTESTKRQSSTYHPHWNEEVVFIEKFPSLCTRIMVSLVDWGLRNERVATHFIELDQIMDASSDECTHTRISVRTRTVQCKLQYNTLSTRILRRSGTSLTSISSSIVQ